MPGFPPPCGFSSPARSPDDELPGRPPSFFLRKKHSPRDVHEAGSLNVRSRAFEESDV